MSACTALTAAASESVAAVSWVSCVVAAFMLLKFHHPPLEFLH
jgi:hypothetical protein